MSEPISWTVTTHDWSQTVDEAHLHFIRDHAGLYGAGGVRHLVLEVLAYANDEAEAHGRGGRADVVFGYDGRVTVRDDGRGTDTRYDSSGRPIRKPVMATRDVRFFDATDPPLLPDGLARRGMSVVAALSSLLTHENRRLNGAWSQTYRHGVPDDELQTLSSPSVAPSGTTVSFIPDPAVRAHRALTESDLAAYTWLEISEQHAH